MHLYIKNMVCDRCKMVVKAELEQLGLQPILVELGVVELQELDLDKQQMSSLLKNLKVLGFDLIEDKNNRLVEKIKNLIVDLVHNKNNEINSNLSDYLADNLHQDYNSISHLFSEITNTTIEKYFINQKIEKVKELLIYDELNLNEIANQLNYSSIAHLSNQFKKVMGFSPSHFKKLSTRNRNQIDKL